MESRGIVRSASLIATLTGVSRILGLFRDMLMAGMFGTSMAMSAFVVAFKIPNFFRALFGEGALSAAFVPVFVETRAEGESSAWALANGVFSLLSVVLAALVVSGMVGLSLFLQMPNLAPRVELTLRLARILLPYLWCICLAAAFMGVLHAHKRFAIPAAVPWLLNGVLIGTVLWWAPRWGEMPEERIYAVCVAVLVAGVLQAGVQALALRRLGFRWRPGWSWTDSRLRHVLALMAPAALGRAATQVNVVIDGILALWIGAWAPAALYFSDRLVQLPIGLFATALATVLLPVLSGHAAKGNRDALLRTAGESLRLLGYVMIPASFGLLALSRPIIEWAFQWGVFESDSVELSARALRFYAPVLIVYPLSKVLVPAFHALQDTRTPARIGLAAVGVNILLSIVFMATWPPGYQHAGLAMATVLAATLNGAGLVARFSRRVGSPGWTALTRAALRLMAGGIALFFTVRWVHGAIGSAAPGDEPGKTIGLIALMGAGFAGAGVYTAVVAALGGREPRELLTALGRKRR